MVRASARQALSQCLCRSIRWQTKHSDLAASNCFLASSLDRQFWPYSSASQIRSGVQRDLVGSRFLRKRMFTWCWLVAFQALRFSTSLKESAPKLAVFLVAGMVFLTAGMVFLAAGVVSLTAGMVSLTARGTLLTALGSAGLGARLDGRGTPASSRSWLPGWLLHGRLRGRRRWRRRHDLVELSFETDSQPEIGPQDPALGDLRETPDRERKTGLENHLC
jgi:hypothetical protein